MDERAKFRNLTVWNKAQSFAVMVYGLASKLPSPERYGLSIELTRAAAAVAAAIAEGSASLTDWEYAEYVAGARKSLLKSESYLLLAVELKYLSEAQIQDSLNLGRNIDKLLTTFRRRLAARTLVK